MGSEVPRRPPGLPAGGQKGWRVRNWIAGLSSYEEWGWRGGAGEALFSITTLLLGGGGRGGGGGERLGDSRWGYHYYYNRVIGTGDGDSAARMPPSPGLRKRHLDPHSGQRMRLDELLLRASGALWEQKAACPGSQWHIQMPGIPGAGAEGAHTLDF